MIDGVTRLGLPQLPGVRYLYVNRSVTKTHAARWTSGSNLSFSDVSFVYFCYPPPQKTTKYILYNVTAKYWVSRLPKYGRTRWGIKKMKNLPNIALLYELPPIQPCLSVRPPRGNQIGLQKKAWKRILAGPTSPIYYCKMKDAGYIIKNANIWLSINNASFY